MEYLLCFGSNFLYWGWIHFIWSFRLGGSLLYVNVSWLSNRIKRNTSQAQKIGQLLHLGNHKNKQSNKQKKQILARLRYFGQLLRLGNHKNKQTNQQKTNTSHTQKIGQLLRLGNHHTPYIFHPSRIYITNNKYQVMAITRHCSRVLDT